MADVTARLVSALVTRLSPEGADEATRRERALLAVRLLCSRIRPRVSLDPVHVRHLIASLLARNRISTIAFDELFEKLMRMGVIEHKASVLYLIYALSSHADEGYTIPAPMTSQTPLMDFTGGTADTTPVPATDTEPRNKDTVTTRDEDDIDSVSDSSIVHDMFFILQGSDGDLVKFSKGNVYVPDTIPSDLANIACAISEMGKLFARVRKYTENPGADGRVQQALTAALKDQLTQYYRLIAVLEQQCSSSTGLTLKQAFVWVQRPLKCMRTLALLAEGATGISGGALISIFESYSCHGDRSVRELIQSLLGAAAKPLFDFLQTWISTGEVKDPFGEFFIKENRSCSADLFWQDMFTLRPKMIPLFVGPALAERILSLGKSVNFIRRCGDLPKWSSDAAVSRRFQEIVYGDTTQFESVLSQAGASINKRLLDIVCSQYSLMLHCTAIKQYILMGQGDFIQHLLDLLFDELSQPAAKLYRHHLNNILESALRATVGHFERPDVMSRLQVRLLQSSPGDSGWEVFTLDYRIDSAPALSAEAQDAVSPLSIVFHPDHMRSYLRMFNFIWRIKRIEHCLSDTWKRQNSDMSRLASDSDLRSLFHKAQTIRHEMVQFVNNLNSFVKYDVIECCWDRFVSSVQKAADLDEVISAHSNYIARLLDKLFIGDNLSPLQKPLSQLCDLILQFSTLQQRLHDAALEEIHIRERSSRRGSALFSRFGSQLDRIQDAYRFQLASFMKLVEPSDMRFLAFQMDFNGFYGNVAEDEEGYTARRTAFVDSLLVDDGDSRL
ncbi:Gamma tubulin complex component C-terminal [Plasmodiophora brassicae]